MNGKYIVSRTRSWLNENCQRYEKKGCTKEILSDLKSHLADEELDDMELEALRWELADYKFKINPNTGTTLYLTAAMVLIGLLGIMKAADWMLLDISVILIVIAAAILFIPRAITNYDLKCPYLFIVEGLILEELERRKEKDRASYPDLDRLERIESLLIELTEERKGGREKTLVNKIKSFIE